MKISIITVCYNSAATLEKTILSVAAQTYADKEHLIVDGASTDETMSIVRSHSSIACVISEPDQGIYDALNKGILLASGDVIGILNADDVYAHDNVLEHVAQAFLAGDLDAVFADITFFNKEQPDKVIRRFSSKDFSPSRIAWGWMPAHPSLFIKRHVYQQVGLFKTNYKIAGDYEFVARAFGSNKLRYKYLPEVFVKMRAGGVSTGGWQNTILLNQEVLRACRENGLKTNIFKILSKYPLKLLEKFFK